MGPLALAKGVVTLAEVLGEQIAVSYQGPSPQLFIQHILAEQRQGWRPIRTAPYSGGAQPHEGQINQELPGKDIPGRSSTSTGPQVWKKLLSLGNGESSESTERS